MLYFLTYPLAFCGPLLLIGDFNLPDIDWSSLTADTPPSRLFCNSLFSHNLVQLIHSPTHSHGNILDLIVTSHPEIISQVIVGDAACCSVSDHSLVSFSVTHSYSFSRCKSSYIYKYQDADVEGIDSYFSTLIVPSLLQSDVEAAWNFVKSSIFAARDLFVPRVFVPASSLPRWFDAELRHELHQVRSLRRRVFKASSPTDYLLYKLHNMESQLQLHISLARERYLLHISSQFFLQPKFLFSHLRSLTKSSTIPLTVSMGSCSASDPIGKATLFISYFNSIFTVSDFVLPPLQSLPSPSSQLHHISISSSDVLDALAALQHNKAPGVDDLSPSLIKLCSGPLLQSLTNLFSNCLLYQKIPSEWKTHKISPIPKGGDPSLVSNYRPISLLCILSKVLETIVYRKIIDFLQPLISKSQFGFLRRRSCLSQLLDSFNYIFEAVENNSSVEAVYLDFRKAFDTVPHQELLYKLWLSGITGPLWRWFQCYLSNRQHFTCIDGVASACLPVSSGVPQGSILGPLLFILYTNDLPSNLQSPVYMFADDTKLLRVITSFNDNNELQSDLNSIGS